MLSFRLDINMLFFRGSNAACDCVPFLEKIGKKIEEDKREIIGHINQRSKKLDTRLDLLETKTKNQIFNFHQTMKVSISPSRKILPAIVTSDFQNQRRMLCYPSVRHYRSETYVGRNPSRNMSGIKYGGLRKVQWVPGYTSIFIIPPPLTTTATASIPVVSKRDAKLVNQNHGIAIMVE